MKIKHAALTGFILLCSALLCFVYADLLPMTIRIINTSTQTTNIVRQSIVLPPDTPPVTRQTNTNTADPAAIANTADDIPADTPEQDYAVIISQTNIILPPTENDIQPRIAAVIRIEPRNVPPVLAERLTSALREKLRESDYIDVISENDMNTALNNQGLNPDYCEVVSCGVSVGRIIDADTVIMGNIEKSNQMYNLHTVVINVSNASVEYTHSISEASPDLIEAVLEPMATSIVQQIENDIITLQQPIPSAPLLPHRQITNLQEELLVEIDQGDTTDVHITELTISTQFNYIMARVIAIDLKKDDCILDVGAVNGVTKNDKIAVSVPIERTVMDRHNGTTHEVMTFQQIAWLDVIDIDETTCRARIIGGGTYAKKSENYLLNIRKYVIDDMDEFYKINLCEEKY